jgi:UDP-N-acetyl-D-galactosamine dehydrogenase
MRSFAMSERIGVIGLGYVGLPVALAFAEKFDHVVGFDINSKRVSELRKGVDRTGEANPELLEHTTLTFTDNGEELAACTFFVVTVPTPIDTNKRPDLSPVESASRSVGKHLKKGDVVVYESTVYPGVTEDICGPILESVSGLTSGKDFTLGYSPERINPGDKVHTLSNIVKVVSGQDDDTLKRVASVYEQIIDAGVHRAPTIKVAEAAKVIENTQRDLNIALMNELSLIFDKLDIRTKDVLEAAGTKWNFLPFFPGLVGGHCIGVDPYYLTTKAQEVGYEPEVILAGRKINDGMGAFVAQKVVKMLINEGAAVRDARVAVFGLTFKENCPDLRNSRVPDIIHELSDFGVNVLVTDPRADKDEAMDEYGIELHDAEELTDLDAAIIAVSHREYAEAGPAYFEEKLGKYQILADVKSIFRPEDCSDGTTHWSL